MHIERIDPAALTFEIAEQIVRVKVAAQAVDRPFAMAPSAEGLVLGARHGHDGTPSEAMWLARDDAGGVVGHATLDFSHWDNPQLAFAECDVAPTNREQGIGGALLAAQLALTGELGRSSLLAFPVEDSAAAVFLAANGFQVGLRQVQRRLDLTQLDYGHIVSLATDAADHAADYELVRLDGAAPDVILPELVALFEAINDAPLDDLAADPDEFPVERLRRYDIAMRARKQHVYRLLAQHRPSGEWAGHTIVCVDETRPGYAVQEDTSVIRAHRGHRLGMWLKASMLLWMRDTHPELTAIDTWNALSNHHMIAVNEALGCQVSQLGVAMQRTL